MEVNCVICDKPDDGSFSVASEQSFLTIRTFSEDWSKMGKSTEQWNRLQKMTFSADEIFKYHRACYQSLCHKGMLTRAQKKYEKDIAAAAIEKIRGRPSSDVITGTLKKRKIFDSDSCVFCQRNLNGEIAYCVRSPQMGQKFLNIKETTADKELQSRLAFLFDEMDAFTQDMKYHTTCFRRETREKRVHSATSSEQENIRKAICDIEIVNIVQSLISPGTACSEVDLNQLDMNSIEETFKSLLLKNDVPIDPEKRYKRHIKNLLLESIPDIEFAKRGPKPEIVFSTNTKEKVMAHCYESVDVNDEIELLFKASKILRKEISDMEEWSFNGTFDDFSTPVKLQQFMKWIISGPYTDLNATREMQIEKSSRNLAQSVISSFRSRRQVSYETKNDSNFQKNKRTPLSVGLALTSYQENRSRSCVEMLSNLQLAISYDDVQQTTTRIAVAIMKDMQEKAEGFYIPPFVKKYVRPVFAIDNIDLGSDAGSFHGADLMIAQKDVAGVPKIGCDLKLDVTVRNRTLPQTTDIFYYDCNKPHESTLSHTMYRLDTLKGTSTSVVQANLIWLILSSTVVAQMREVDGGASITPDCHHENVEGDELHAAMSSQMEIEVDRSASQDVIVGLAGAAQSFRDAHEKPSEVTTEISPTWSTFHSLTNDNIPVWNVGIAAPLYRRSPTEWPVLFTILQHAQRINAVTMGEGLRPIITLDGDLYDRAVKLKDYKKNWCIRLGALHTIMAALKCLGKYVEGSGLDLAWEAAGLYGSSTVRQILDGRHIYRCIEAHTVTLLALFTLYMEVVFSEEERVQCSMQIQPLIETFGSYVSKKTDSTAEVFMSQVTEVKNAFLSNKVFERLDTWKQNGKGNQKFLSNYMDQVQVLLAFIAATRTCNWKLHLASSEELLPYFHAHDQYNYGRWSPLYVADMLELQTTDPETWKFLDDGNFAIAKHGSPFTAIDPDHAIEQEHRKMKVKGGFIGITGDEHALAKYFIIAPTLCQVSQEFKEYAGIQVRQPSSLHHEVAGLKSENLIKNGARIIKAITKQGNPFLSTDMCNLITFAVTPSNVCENIENRDKLGRQALEKFVSTRMIEKTVKFWSPQRKNNFSYFKDTGVSVHTKVKDKLVLIKQERNLLSRLLVASKSRPDISVQDVIGEYEFSVAPPSNFNHDGSMLMLSGKSQVLSLVMNMPLSENTVIHKPEVDVPSVLIIDAMCIVNMVPKTPDMSNVMQFAKKFVDAVEAMSKAYQEVRVVFDRYLTSSLKEATRDKRTKGTAQVHYHVNDDTQVKNWTSFFSHINTKGELTKYLSDKLLKHYKGKSQRLLVMYHTIMEANCPLSNITSMPEMSGGQHNLEEGDQLVILNAFDVMHKNPESALDVYSVDTDVFVLLLGNFPRLPKSTTFIPKKDERISIQENFMKLGEKHSEALIGWYSFKGTDNTGSFAGKGVLSHFKAFIKADDDILDAFAKFGVTHEIPQWIHNQMDRYVCLLYKTSDISACSIPDLRWMLFAQKGKEGAHLPPTVGTLIPHTSRAYYMALVWKSSQKPCPQLPQPTSYSWESVGDKLKPVFCLKAPAPEALLQLCKCNCTRDCTRKSCGCRKYQLPCTDLCGCGDACRNITMDRPVNTEETDIV